VFDIKPTSNLSNDIYIMHQLSYICLYHTINVLN